MQFLYRHKISIITIIGCVLLSVGLLVDTLQSISPAINRAKSIIETRLHKTEKKANAILHNQQVLAATNEYAAVRNAIQHLDNDKDILIYIYKDGILNYWSDNSFIPDNIYKLSQHDIYFLKEGNGFYEVLNNKISDGVQLYALIPIYHQYATDNKFLINGFVWKHPFLKRFVISSKETKTSSRINSINGTYLFSIRIADDAQKVYNPYIIVVELIGLLLLFWAMYQVIKNAFVKRKNKLAFAFIVLVIVATDVMFVELQLFSLTKTSLLFSSNLYASAYLGDSLGALLVRVFLLAWSLSFIRFIQTDFNKQYYKVWLLILPIAVYFLLVFIIQSVIQNSVISFNFYLANTLDRYTFISLLVFGFGFSSLLFLMKWIFEHNIDKHFFKYVFVFGVFGLLIGFKLTLFTDVLYACFLLLWLLTFVLFFYYEKSFFQQNKKYKFLSNLILLSFIAFLTSVIIIVNTNQKDIEKRKYRMEELVSERDIGEEYTLTESENNILQDNFVKSYFKNPYLSTVNIENRITSKYFKPLLRRYTINTYAFDKDGMPLIGVTQKEFYKLNNTRHSRKAKSISSQYYYLSIKENGEKYLGYFPIQDDSLNIGYLFVEFIPKIFSSYSAYPELLLKHKNYFDEEFDNFSYAIYDNKYLVKQKGDYEYQVTFNFPVKENKEFSVYKNDDYTHMIYFSKEKQVVLSEKNRPALSTLSVFSYMVIFFLAFFLCMDLFGFSDRFWDETSIRNFFKGNTLQKQIQNSMLALVLFSLAIIGIVTLVYFQYQYNIYHNSKLLKKVNAVMKNTAQYYVEEYPVYGDNTFDKIIQQKIKVLSSIHALDINVYNVKGDLIQSSQPEIFKRNLVSSKMDADAYYNLIVKEKSKYVHDEKIGKLSYLSAYQPFRSNGKVLGYFNFPYYGKQKSFQEDISYFLVALVNVYVVFLIAAALLAVFLSRSITNSLTLISDNIKDVQFGKFNKKIIWKNEDEIGLLVHQYNLMLDELEKSADLLAKSEREGAWREMAKQVAHEIKNPLTPMKLSIQHLQRALKDNSPDITELTSKISHRLIEQIDNLSGIATAFSDFAKMPQGVFKPIDIVPILESTVELFREEENINISLDYPSTACVVLADKDQLMRVFTNIIKNAIQAIPENKIGLIDIHLLVASDNYLITVKDNGVGIANEKREHIFEPNFTTKSSGTGLGLAISRNIIERMNGKIWFESIVDEYSIFYIQIPKTIN
ncbi:MAG TPA: HAMP domain-containing sensor histidine kinase [Chitinophagales bacterium]|nr:HAMP domain-containing sensor histidine kinase [Chitinophagales bacterium]HNA38171.1 HAMP domain-containing sensor histidine kinase [Chitinophagales bacterium]HNF18173.1 HAMP domain-containing sensor histidine kinase [Chitinophagales bacterium]HNK10682.1 HAMP domain-containing sensor histidine kinase [Chitinophagales bacterium]